MSVEQRQDNIQAYFRGSMSTEEKQAFESEVLASPVLAEEVHRYRQIRVLTRTETLLQSKHTLAAVMAETSISPDYGKYEQYFTGSGKWGWLKGWLPSLLVIGALLTGSTAYYYYQQQQMEQQRLFSVLVPFDNIIGFAADDPSTAAAGMRAYDKQDYATAIQYLSTAVQESPDDPSIQMYLGVSYLLQNDPARGEPLLRPLTQSNELVSVPARWYLALCLLQQGKKAAAQPLLDALRTDTVYGELVKRLEE